MRNPDGDNREGRSSGKGGRVLNFLCGVVLRGFGGN